MACRHEKDLRRGLESSQAERNSDFKWADKDVTLAELLYVLKRQPLLGDKKPSANKAGTNRFWLVFFKEEEGNADK